MTLRVIVLQEPSAQDRIKSECPVDVEATRFEVTPTGVLLLFAGPTGAALIQAFAPGRWSRVFQL